ncbi:cell envelope integrity protein TolA [Candidatus Methylopumilus turicensis]|uniref:Protein TolA n=1 Tax=Candidatus Methylopumilus turicensis TaxID=1581680 RepID=A0A0B7IZZ1_9PROT|nr:cell envelope integrity protein TolA [Candidatus Methylopumilus turicensis]CEN56635.1 Protein TolA [Candidatus Methylopumilus turicensis]
MFRQHEKEVVWQAGAFTALVHGLLFALFLVSFQWKTVQPMNIAQVELWDSVPSPKAEPTPAPPDDPTPTPEPPKVLEPIKPEPKVEAEVKETSKAEIQTKKTPVLPPKIETPKPELVKPKELPKEPIKPEKTKADAEALKKLQQSLLAEDAQSQKREPSKPEASQSGSKTAQIAQAGSANAGEVDKYKSLISSKIKQHVNKQLCGNDKAMKVSFTIALMPTGEVMGRPKLIKESGMSSCDDAVERAILESQPLPVPSSADLFSQFRELNLVFRPNDTN